jgi:hypothetical protein
MPIEDPQLSTKLATLRTMQREGASPRVAELLLGDWPSPDGPVYYATRVAVDLLDNLALLDRLDGAEIELRLGSGVFLEVPQEAGIGDDKIDLDFWDGDHELTRLFQTHGPGIRVEVFYYFPEVDLLVTEWWGHLQPPDEGNLERFKTTAQSGFRSSKLSLPARGFYSGCQNVFGGLLGTQAEIDEGGCPYSRHLGGTPSEDSFGTDTTWLQTAMAPADNWADADFDDSGWASAVEQSSIGETPWTWGDNPSPFPPSAVAKWIWSHDSRARANFDNATVYFRKSFVAADTKAILVLTGDNSFSAFLNGQQIVFGDDWRQSYSAVLTLEVGETYVIAARVVNGAAIDGNVPSPGGLLAVLSSGVEGVGFGNLDPDTGLPYTSCPRNSRAASIARLGDDRSFLAFDTIVESHTVHETKGPNITVTSRGNETNLKRALRVIAGRRHVSDLDLLAYVVEPNTKHPDQGSVKGLFGVAEGPNQSVSGGKINDQTIAPEHSNYRIGAKRQPPTSFSPNILSYSSTALFLGVAQGDFTKAGADDLRGAVEVEGLNDVRVYSDAETYTLEYTSERGWWLLHCLRNKRWGYGLDARRAYIPDWIEIAAWFKEIVSVKDKDGNIFTGPRSQFNAELIERSAQQQVEDICRSGRLSLPFPDKGKLRVVPLRRAAELFSTAVFTDKAFFGALARPADNDEREGWFEALLDARALSPAELLAECKERVSGLFTSDEYDDRTRTDEEFISDCYTAYLRRDAAADPAGAAFWLNDLATFSPPELAREHILQAFAASTEFAADCSDGEVPTFTDRGDDRNVCLEEGKSTLSYSQQSDAELPNRVILTVDDAAHENKQVPLTFESVEQQLRAGRAFGDTSKRAVQKEYNAFGVTDMGEGGRLGNLLLDLGEFDEGGLQNNLRWKFTTWYLETVGLHPYRIIKIDCAKLDVINTARLVKGLEPFTYFRIRSLKRMPDLKVEVTCQAYPVEYYERLELLTQGPPITPTGPIDHDPEDPDSPGDPRRRLPFNVPLDSVGHNDDQILFEIGREAV